ncbi:LamG domain-containing protein [Candidatus Poribacteria bacterium]|nr:LamG domain-containing protein [Candidatus Poribacteria bacterium]
MMKNLVLYCLLLVSIGSTGTAFEPEMVTEGLVGFWSFDQETIKGKIVKDIWSKNDGTIKGAPKNVKGKFGQSLSFDGRKDLVKIPHHASLNLKKEVTIEFWFLLQGQSGDNEYPRPVSKGQSLGDNSGYGVWVRDTRNPTDIGFRSATLIPKDTRGQGLPSYDNKSWHHVLLSFNGKQGSLYLDGKSIVDQPVKGDLSQNKEPLHIGDALGMRHFNGLIDEVRVYNRGLTSAEARQNFEIKTNSLSVTVDDKMTTVWAKLRKINY